MVRINARTSAATAFGSSVGVGPDVSARRTLTSHLINGTDGALMIAAAAGVLLLVHRRGRHVPLWLVVVLAWLGGGSLFGWGLWHMIVVLSEHGFGAQPDTGPGAI